WQQPAKQRRIFKGEHAREHVLPEITDDERRLNAAKMPATTLECLPCLQQLIRMRTIFRIINRNQFTASEVQGIVQCLWLGTWPTGWHDNKLELGRQASLSDLLDRFPVIALANQLYVQLARRP